MTSVVYSYEVPGYFIWIIHIFIGLFLFYVGYMVLNSKPLNQFSSLVLIILGSFALVYHTHLYYINTKYPGSSLNPDPYHR